jgi:hypothetical protein
MKEPNTICEEEKVVDPLVMILTPQQSRDDSASASTTARCEVRLVSQEVRKLESKLKSQRKLFRNLRNHVEICKAQEGLLECLSTTLEAARATQLIAKVCEDKNYLKENGLVWKEVKLFDEDLSDSSGSKPIPTKISANEQKKLLAAYLPATEAVHPTTQRLNKNVVARCA